MRRIVLLSLPLSAALVGCTPHDAEVTGSYASYFAAASSENIYRLEAKLVDFTNETTRDNYKFTPVDCRDLADEVERLPGAEDYETDCAAGEADFYPWLTQYAYYLREEQFDPWRVEAVQTTEGDIQLTVHSNVSKIGDFRFGWVIDPDFQPTYCVDGETGAEEQADQGEWLPNWSLAEDGGTLFHLNAGAYQVNPSNQGDYWYLGRTWEAGYGFARMADEDFYGHAIDYVDNISVDSNGYPSPLYQPMYNGHWGSSNNYAGFLSDLTEAVTFTEEHPSDLAALGKSTFPLEIKVEDNSWRPDNDVADDPADGFANWVGLDSSWVHFDDSPDDLALRVPGHQDKPLVGHFQIYLESASAASKVFVEGDFTIDHIRKDIWGYSPSLEQRKMDENNTPVCGEERLTTDEG